MLDAMDSANVARSFYKKLGVSGLARLASDRMTKSYLVAFRRFLVREDRILDVGCGYGRIALPLVEQGFHVEGIDVAANMIKRAQATARSRNLKVHFRVGDMRRLPYAAGSFTKIVCLWSCFDDLLNIRDQRSTLREMLRVLQPGGCAIVEMLNGEQKQWKDAILTSGFPPKKRLWRETVNGIENISFLHTRETLRSLCRSLKIARYTVSLMNIHGRRRLVMVLYR